MFENISVIGGDLRQLTVAKLLKAEGITFFYTALIKIYSLKHLNVKLIKIWF